ncbi:MAG: anthranilate synthase component I family protein [Phycisphaerae bacterium]
MTPQAMTFEKKSVACVIHFKRVDRQINLTGLSELFSNLSNPSILGGSDAKINADGFSYWAAEPREIFEFHSHHYQPFEKLGQILDKYKLQKKVHDDLPNGIFVGGWIGYFSYELGRYIEKIPETAADDLKMPLTRLCFYDKVICYDHRKKVFWLIALEITDDRVPVSEKLQWLNEKLNESQKITVQLPEATKIQDIDLSQVRSNMDKASYLDALAKIRRYIYDGIVYQVNFSHRFECDYKAEPIKLFHWQNQYNPSGHAAYILTDDFSIVSASPEMFITLKDGIISTKPIKGTRPRFAETGAESMKINERNFAELAASEKEQAELNMIIDLERNDLARICRPGTRVVTQPRTIESYPTVFHAVAVVSGRLRDDVRFCDIMRAMFPGGSITGAPKVSAMEIIDQTEPTVRGVYTGSIGYIGIDENACLNIAIRTVIVKDNKAYAQTGGGIVADSDPQAEWDETIVKARALLAGINSVQRSA